MRRSKAFPRPRQKQVRAKDAGLSAERRGDAAGDRGTRAAACRPDTRDPQTGRLTADYNVTRGSDFMLAINAAVMGLLAVQGAAAAMDLTTLVDVLGSEVPLA